MDSVLLIQKEMPVRDMADSALIEPAFLSKLDIVDGDKTLGVRVSNYLAHKIVRQVADLESHIQRIIIYSRFRNADAVYGALLDLFIVLGNKGFAIRQRMLRMVAKAIGRTRYARLLGVLERGITSDELLPYTPYSMLSGSFVGASPLVYKCSADDMEIRSPLDEARDLVDSGMIDEGRKLLESSLLLDRGNEALNVELLEIYKHTQNKDAFNEMFVKIGRRPLAAIDEWKSLSVSFEESGVLN